MHCIRDEGHLLFRSAIPDDRYGVMLYAKSISRWGTVDRASSVPSGIQIRASIVPSCSRFERFCAPMRIPPPLRVGGISERVKMLSDVSNKALITYYMPRVIVLPAEKQRSCGDHSLRLARLFDGRFGRGELIGAELIEAVKHGRHRGDERFIISMKGAKPVADGA